MIVFATVGTTSFDTLVSSLCSLPSLSAMAAAAAAKTSQHRLRRTPSQSKHSQSSSPLVSAQLSTSTSPVAVPSAQSYSISLHSCSSSLPLSSGAGDDSGGDNIVVELVIQYGTGTCPLSFLPPSLKQRSLGGTDEHEIDDCGEGSTLLLIPTSSNGTQQYHRLHMKWYRFQPSLVHDMERADIILCHAGAGTLLEALAISKPYDINTIQLQRPIINAVINTSLMNNHQSELAEELHRRRHIHVTWDCISEWTTDVEAKRFWKNLDGFCPVPFVGSDRSAQRGKSCFQRNVDDVMGVNIICEPEVNDLAKDKKDS